MILVSLWKRHGTLAGNWGNTHPTMISLINIILIMTIAHFHVFIKMPYFPFDLKSGRIWARRKSSLSLTFLEKETETGLKWLAWALQLAARSLQFPGPGFFPHPHVSQRLKAPRNKLLRKYRGQITQAHGSHPHQCPLKHTRDSISLGARGSEGFLFASYSSMQWWGDQPGLTPRISIRPVVGLALLYW